MRRISRVKLHMATAISRLFGPHLQAPTERDFVHMKGILKAIAVYCQVCFLIHLPSLFSNSIPYYYYIYGVLDIVPLLIASLG